MLPKTAPNRQFFFHTSPNQLYLQTSLPFPGLLGGKVQILQLDAVAV